MKVLELIKEIGKTGFDNQVFVENNEEVVVSFDDNGDVNISVGANDSEPIQLEPERKKAIAILEAIEEKLGDEKIFDCKDGDTKWYDFEDMIVDILTQ